MGFVVPSKTFAALLGTSFFIATNPSAVSARIVGPSDIHVQAMEGSTEEEMNGCVAECMDKVANDCSVKCEDLVGTGKLDNWGNCIDYCFQAAAKPCCTRTPLEPSKHSL